jgi:hypothetical protein
MVVRQSRNQSHESRALHDSQAVEWDQGPAHRDGRLSSGGSNDAVCAPGAVSMVDSASNGPSSSGMSGTSGRLPCLLWGSDLNDVVFIFVGVATGLVVQASIFMH